MMRRLSSVFLTSSAVLAAAVLAVAGPNGEGDVRAEGKTIRLSIVNTPVMSGLIQDLVKNFEASSPFKVQVSRSQTVFDDGRDGGADIVIAHYGKAGLKSFVLEGFGHWPEPVFANQLVLVGPKSDPARVRDAKSLNDAFRRITENRSPLVRNEIPGVMYLEEIISATGDGRGVQSGNVVTGYAKGRAMKQAQKLNGYAIWGAFPFFRFQRKHNSALEVVHAADPLLQRMMASVVVRKDRLGMTNEAGAIAFQRYLLSPDAQARIANFRSKDVNFQLWWPRGRDGSPVRE